jgi:site-specific DNA-methyltransferase (adenine-specific)
VTDPPYGLEFMGREWDAPWKHGFGQTGYTDADRLPRPNFGSSRNPVCQSCHKHQRGTKRCECPVPQFDERPADSNRGYQRWCEQWAAECLRVLRPGGHLLAFGGTRTYHRLACAVEDAGFEIRDSLHWLYGSGFPKSKDVGKAIDKAAGAEREVLQRIRTKGGGTEQRNRRQAEVHGYRPDGYQKGENVLDVTAPATDAAARWDGWGTALKPAHEPIVLARKPLTGTVAGNVLEHGTGAINVDGCRVGMSKDVPASPRRAPQGPAYGELGNDPGTGSGWDAGTGRWPPNVLLTHSADCNGDCAPDCPVAELDQQSGHLIGCGGPKRTDSGETSMFGIGQPGQTYERQGGGASRFFPCFRYQAKAPSSERPRLADGTAWPTVKPLELMRWLVRLVTPPGGTVLDPFAGTGTTGQACALEGFHAVLIERDPAALALAQQRLSRPMQGVLGD